MGSRNLKSLSEGCETNDGDRFRAFGGCPSMDWACDKAIVQSIVCTGVHRRSIHAPSVRCRRHADQPVRVAWCDDRASRRVVTRDDALSNWSAKHTSKFRVGESNSWAASTQGVEPLPRGSLRHRESSCHTLSSSGARAPRSPAPRSTNHDRTVRTRASVGRSGQGPRPGVGDAGAFARRVSLDGPFEGRRVETTSSLAARSPLVVTTSFSNGRGR